MGKDDHMNSEQDAAFREWQRLAFQAAKTKAADDAHAAGQAFGRFFYTYVANTYRPAKIIPFRRRNNDFGGVA